MCAEPHQDQRSRAVSKSQWILTEQKAFDVAPIPNGYVLRVCLLHTTCSVECVLFPTLAGCCTTKTTCPEQHLNRSGPSDVTDRKFVGERSLGFEAHSLEPHQQPLQEDGTKAWPLLLSPTPCNITVAYALEDHLQIRCKCASLATRASAKALPFSCQTNSVP